MSAYLQISGLTKQYGRLCALSEVELNVARGKVLAVLGPNGAGKSTLFGCLLGLTFPTRGKILLEGRPITDADRASMGYAAERVSLFPHRTVAQNCAFFAQLKGQSMGAVENALARVGLKSVKNRKVGQISKGMLQRLGLAISLCGEPELLVLDEPFNGLDPVVLETVQNLLAEERERGTTILLSTHTLSAVEPLATHVAILLEGRLAATGSLDHLRAEQEDSASLEMIYRQIARRRDASLELCA
jgi:ABC-type multidrug transport system ATPase subunit